MPLPITDPLSVALPNATALAANVVASGFKTLKFWPGCEGLSVTGRLAGEKLNPGKLGVMV